MSHAGVKRITLNYLTPSSTDFFVVGVIIAKRSPSKFKSKKDGSDRGVLGFTLRDSPADYINVTVWGSHIFVQNFNSSYRVGDVVDIINPKVTMRKLGKLEKDETFQPPATSFMELMFNENHSKICLHDFEDSLDYIKLFHLPTKPPGNFLCLADIKKNGKLFTGQYVNILVAVQKIGNKREMKGRNGQDYSVLEVLVLDKTSSGFMIKAWNDDVIQRGLEWKPRETVLFISDVKIDWSSFRKAMVATITNRSIVTENPSTREAAVLAAFAHSVPLESTALADSLANTAVDADSIVNVMSCAGVLQQAWSRNSSDSFTALVYAVLYRFDIDGVSNIVVKKCPSCRLVTESSICPKEECVGGIPEDCYDIVVSLGDHTGKLSHCRLTDASANAVMSVRAQDFHSLEQDVRTKMKWDWLLKKVAARLLVFPAGLERLGPQISVVRLQTISLTEFSARVPVA